MSAVPSLYEVGQLIQDNGLEGEEDTALVTLLGTFLGGFVIVYGDSSAGKDEMTNSVIACYPNEGVGDVFKVPNSTSPLVLLEKAPEANDANIHVYPDSTDLPEHIEGLIKAHAEGREYTHEFLEVQGGRSVEGRNMTPPDCIIYPWARNNNNFDINEHAELRNRAIVLEVDGSKEQTERVNTRQAMEEAGLYVRNTTIEEAEVIREHVGTIRGRIDRFGRKASIGKVRNPTMMAIDRMKPIPQHFPEARRDFPRLMRFMRAVTLYNWPERMETVDSGGNPVILVTPADAWLAMKIFGEKLVMSALNLTDRDMLLIAYLRVNAPNGFTVSELQQSLRENGENVEDSDVKKSLKSMKHKGYVTVQKGESGVNEWSSGPFAAQATHQSRIIWEEVVAESEEVVRDILTEGDAEEYVARYCRGDGLLVTHPFTGEVVNITEDDEFDQELADAESEMADVFDEPVYAGPDSHENDDTAALGAFANDNGLSTSGSL